MHIENSMGELCDKRFYLNNGLKIISTLFQGDFNEYWQGNNKMN